MEDPRNLFVHIFALTWIIHLSQIIFSDCWPDSLPPWTLRGRGGRGRGSWRFFLFYFFFLFIFLFLFLFLKRRDTDQTRHSAFCVFVIVLIVFEVTGNTTARYLGMSTFSLLFWRASKVFYCGWSNWPCHVMAILILLQWLYSETEGWLRPYKHLHVNRC